MTTALEELYKLFHHIVGMTVTEIAEELESILPRLEQEQAQLQAAFERYYTVEKEIRELYPDTQILSMLGPQFVRKAFEMMLRERSESKVAAVEAFVEKVSPRMIERPHSSISILREELAALKDGAK